MTDENIPTPEDEITDAADEAVEADAADAADEPVESVADAGLTGQLRALEMDLVAEPVEGFADDEPAWGDEADDEAAPLEDEAPSEGVGVDDLLFATSVISAGGPDEGPVFDDAVEEPALRGVDMGPERRGRWWIWALIVAAVVLVAGGVGLGYWWVTGRPLVVPDVVGRQPAEATQILNDAGLRVGSVSEVPTDAPEGTVISQDPAPDKKLKPRAKVSLTVAVASEYTDVPDVEGTELVAAESELARLRLRAHVIESENASVAVGFIISQLPSAGVELEPGSFVALVVSKGPAAANVAVPHLTGMVDTEAARFVDAVGLVSAVYRSVDASIPAGQVIAQTPAPGSAVAVGSVVQVLVSQGAKTGFVSAPDVTGKLRADAVKKLESKKFKVDVRESYSASVPKGEVISQMPPSTAKMTSGGTVGLVVSKGAATSGPVPSLVGTLSAEASKTASAAGFNPVILTIAVSGHEAGKVFMQFPLPGVSHKFGLPLVCLVAEAPKK